MNVGGEDPFEIAVKIGIGFLINHLDNSGLLTFQIDGLLAT